MEERKNDWKEVECALSDEELKEQTSRCMNCGQPFCHAYGCPLGNLVPDQNRAVAQGDFKRAYNLLSAHSDFPEFTSRICPALCEASCVHQLDEEAVMVRQSEKRIIETAFANGWVVPRPPQQENGKRVAVIGAGPSGLSAAVTLRRRGWTVTVYEREKNIGGLLRYGIPYFKLDKSLIDRRRAILEAEGIRFVTGVNIGTDVTADYLAKSNDAVVVAIGTPAARDLKIPGRELHGIHLALEYLGGQNRALGGEIAANPINANGIFVPMIQNDTLFGLPVYTTNCLRKTVEGTTTEYIGLGDFAYQPMGLFGSLRFIVDPYSQARKDAIDFVLNTDYATKTLIPEAFILGEVGAESD